MLSWSGDKTFIFSYRKNFFLQHFFSYFARPLLFYFARIRNSCVKRKDVLAAMKKVVTISRKYFHFTRKHFSGRTTAYSMGRSSCAVFGTVKGEFSDLLFHLPSSRRVEQGTRHWNKFNLTLQHYLNVFKPEPAFFTVAVTASELKIGNKRSNTFLAKIFGCSFIKSEPD